MANLKVHNSLTILSLEDSAIFFDDFNRTDGSPENGWLQSTNDAGDLVIVNGVLTNEQSGDGSQGAAISRPIDLSGSVTISADITEKNGFGGLLQQYGTGFFIGSDGVHPSGYGIFVVRSDQNSPDSQVILLYNNSPLDTAYSTFQFGAEVSVTVTIAPDGSVSGSVSGDGNLFDFGFGPREVVYAGDNVSIFQQYSDPRSTVITLSTIDNLEIVTDAVDDGHTLCSDTVGVQKNSAVLADMDHGVLANDAAVAMTLSVSAVNGLVA